MTEADRIPPFWIVRRMRSGRIGKNGNFFRHKTRELAEAEAERLAAQTPGAQFVVLEAVASYQMEAADVCP